MICVSTFEIVGIVENFMSIFLAKPRISLSCKLLSTGFPHFIGYSGIFLEKITFLSFSVIFAVLRHFLTCFLYSQLLKSASVFSYFQFVKITTYCDLLRLSMLFGGIFTIFRAFCTNGLYFRLLFCVFVP